jgi:hypothetical protein
MHILVITCLICILLPVSRGSGSQVLSNIEQGNVVLHSLLVIVSQGRHFSTATSDASISMGSVSSRKTPKKRNP